MPEPWVTKGTRGSNLIGRLTFTTVLTVKGKCFKIVILTTLLKAAQPNNIESFTEVVIIVCHTCSYFFFASTNFCHWTNNYSTNLFSRMRLSVIIFVFVYNYMFVHLCIQLMCLFAYLCIIWWELVWKALRVYLRSWVESGPTLAADDGKHFISRDFTLIHLIQ